MISLNSSINNSRFRIEIIKQTDSSIINSILALEKAGFEIQAVSIKPKIGNSIIIDIHNLDETAKEYLAKDSEIIDLFYFSVIFNDVSIRIKIERDIHEDNQPVKSNKDFISFEGNIDETNQDISKYFNLLNSEIRKIFKAVYSEKVLKETLSENLNNIYKVREAELIKLENISKDLIINQSKFIEDKQKEIDELKKILKENYTKDKKELEDEYERKQLAIRKRELDFEDKQRLIDDRDSKHARREIRKNLKEEFKARSEKFSLTTGTEDKRKIIHIFTILLLVIFGLGFVLYTGISIYDLINEKAENLLSLSIKNIVFALAFGSTSVFYIRWNNKWFEQHANEEFKMKQYEIDLERASWLVEMALEWQSECKGDIPNELIERLSQNLFQVKNEKQPELHPSDQLASLLFGAASSLNIKTPLGADLTIDRKGINQLKKNV